MLSQPNNKVRPLRQAASAVSVSIYNAALSVSQSLTDDQLRPSHPPIKPSESPLALAPMISPSPVKDWAEPSNGRASLDEAAPVEEPIINAHTLLTSQSQSPPSLIDRLLRFQPPDQGGGYCEDDYIPLDAVAPRYLAVRLKRKTWIVERFGQFRGSLHYPGRTKLTSGAAVHLVDNELATRTLGFMKPHLLGIIGPLYRREPGYTIFHLIIHLYSTAAKFFPRHHQRGYIAIPDHLILASRHTSEYELPTLGQRILSGANEEDPVTVLPPLYSWEQFGWEDPKKIMIERWYEKQQEQLGSSWLTNDI